MQRNSDMAQQYQFRIWQNYEAMNCRQYDSMTTLMMNDFQMSQYNNMTQDHYQDNDDDDDTLIVTSDERNGNQNDMNSILTQNSKIRCYFKHDFKSLFSVFIHTYLMVALFDICLG